MVITLLFYSCLHIVGEEESTTDPSTFDDADTLVKYLKSFFGFVERRGAQWARTYDTPRYKNYTLDEKVKDTINWGCCLNAAAGLLGNGDLQDYVMLLLSLENLSEQMVKLGLDGSFAISFALQIGLISAVATIYKLNMYDYDSPIMWFATAVLVGDLVAEKIGKPWMYKIGKWLFTLKFIGAAFSFVADGGICVVAATLSYPLIFGDGYDTQLVPRDPFHEWLEGERLSSIAGTLTDHDWDMSSHCDITEAHLIEMNITIGHRTRFTKANKAACHVPTWSLLDMPLAYRLGAILLLLILILIRCIFPPRVRASWKQCLRRIRDQYRPVEGAGSGAENPIPGQ